VDDSQFIIDALSKFLTEKLHFTVLGTGQCGDDAINLYRTHRPDLLTLDICMPGKSGCDVVRQIIGEFPEARILIVSAVRGETLFACIEAGAADCVSKPLPFQNPAFALEFEEIVNQVLA
jgi:two-component system chemotaxis response regulator CheY